jgi:putative mycofactocin binding protein MftB
MTGFRVNPVMPVRFRILQIAVPEMFRMEKDCFTLAPHVRVRKEGFGLLFYDTRNTKLTFAHSKELLRIVRSPDRCDLSLAVDGDAEETRARSIMSALRNKGLILEMSAGIRQ